MSYFPIITEHERLLPFYVTGIGIQKSQEPIERANGFPYYQWIYCSKGEGILHTEKQDIVIKPGMGFYFVPNHPHSYKALKEPWETNWITFDGTSLSLFFHDLSFGEFGTFLPENPMKKFFEIEKMLLAEDVNKIINTSPLLYSLLIESKNSLQSTSSSKAVSHTNKLEPVVNYMAKHYQKDLSLEILASTINVSTYYLCKLFNTEFGMTPVQYLIRLRLQVAKELLIHHPEMKIYYIAKNVGYSDTSYFCSVFKKQEGIPPTAFRQMHGIIS